MIIIHLASAACSLAKLVGVLLIANICNRHPTDKRTCWQYAKFTCR